MDSTHPCDCTSSPSLILWRTEEFPPGTGYKREILAYLLDHNSVARVPFTIEARVGGRVGSLQQYIPSCIASSDTSIALFPVEDVQMIAVFDIRVLNCDRHGGNLLWCSTSKHLIPIDHSYILPSGYSDPDFEWLFWTTKVKQPICPEVLEYIESLNPERDADLVHRILGEEAAEIIFATTTILKRAAKLGYSCYEIGSFCRKESLASPSGLEGIIAASRRSIDEGASVDRDVLSRQIEAAFPSKR